MNACPLHSSKFCTYHSSSILKLSFKTILPKKEMFSDKDDICCIWNKSKVYSSKTTWIVDINNPVNFVNSRIDVYRLFKKFWYSETTFSIFVLFKKSSRVTGWLSCTKTLFPALASTQTYSSLWQILNVAERRKLGLGSWVSLEWPINCMSSK